MSPRPYKSVFVCGAPRSGTTVLQSLICTAPDANPVTPECLYLSAIVKAYELGARRYDSHTYFYFDSRAAFDEHNRAMVSALIDNAWTRVGRPALLVLKDPALTGAVPALAELLPEPVFVISIRDPRAVVSSRIEVARKLSNEAVDTAQLKYFCKQYTDYYQPLLNAPAAGDRVLWVAYEDLVAGKGFERIADFLKTTLRPKELWKDSVVPAGADEAAWATELLQGPLSTDSVDRFEKVLTPAEAAYIEAETGAVYRKLQAGLKR